MKTKITAVTLSILAAVMLFTAGCWHEITDSGSGTSRSSNEVVDEKVFWEGSIEEDFDGSSVLLVMDKNISGINKEYDLEFFGGLEIESVMDLSWLSESGMELIDIENFRQILMLKLPEAKYLTAESAKIAKHTKEIL